MIPVPDSWIKFLIEQPETGMGYQIVTVILASGQKYDRVVADSGFFTSVNGELEIPFNPSEIAQIIVTHDKSVLGELRAKFGKLRWQNGKLV